MNRLTCLVIGCTVALLTVVANGQPREHEQELEAARQRVQTMLEQAREADRAGHADAARVARREAEQLAQRIHEHAERLVQERIRQTRRHDDDSDSSDSSGSSDSDSSDSSDSDSEGRGLDHALVILEHLEHGIMAARELDQPELRERLEALADHLRRRIRGARHEGRPRRELPPRPADARQRLEALHLAMEVFSEVDDTHAVELLDRAVRVQERRIAGEPTAGVRAPGPDDVRALLSRAAEICDEHGHERAADRLIDAARNWRDASRRGPRRAAARHEDRLERIMDALRAAGPLLREVQEMDGADMLELALRVHEMTRGERDRPSHRRHLAEMMHAAADIWAEFDGEREAARLHEVAERLGGRAPTHPERARREGRRGQLEEVHHELRELREMIEELRREMERMREG